MSASPRPGRVAGAGAVRFERAWVAALLAVHAALAVWGAARNSVTFDENLHLPAGVMEAARGEFRISAVNPPLVKLLAGAAALAAGARLPADSALADGEQRVVGTSFMRENLDRYHRVYFAARLAIVALSALLGFLVWRFARRLYGARGARVALALYAFAPEALAHAGFVTMDLATGLGFLATTYAFWGFARSGRFAWWLGTALALSFTFLARFSALLLPPVLLALAVLASLRGFARRPLRLWAALLLLAPAVLLALQLGYLGHTSFAPLAEFPLQSRAMIALRDAAPWLRLPLPDAYVGGFDRQLVESQAGQTPTFLLGRITLERVWYYLPLALLFKWPLGFLGALLARGAAAVGTRGRSRRARHEWFVLLPALAYLVTGMQANLNIGVRYVFPALPLLCVWMGGLVPPPARVRLRPPPALGWGRRLALPFVLLQALETALCAPWYLTFFNAPSGGPGGGDRLVNDSNVDWGQGLIGLRDELKRRGIGKIHLAYHGTTDPAVYGIDYVPYLGGEPGPESPWLAVSSYYLVGLSQRMVTPQGPTERIGLDFGPLRTRPPEARPARCMYLFRVR